MLGDFSHKQNQLQWVLISLILRPKYTSLHSLIYQWDIVVLWKRILEKFNQDTTVMMYPNANVY
jgi:hypothetical protein